ncbi:phage tail protein [Pseudomonas monteilii]|uniref:phage tail-collar fiber domain-containing protein n=1 Tax=Pseudomonas monteilii TaxID=76759 RepID=UPI001E599211|nr:phage tail protein [Pseudomonas monteilii]MCE0875963.1 phage tail protein [Pseudomonas monteilii]MCE0930664.1 phage tail protein [Pseudomonas monteilii]MCE0977324.1 phage tail protein [Pseudomonas monteilii]MCE1010841.1 phage tail protein [Pseudomonas monteilii]MCE1039564.1 phage tail protein [Pseudomonas monteilii]
MSTGLQPVITKAGLAAILTATKTGLSAEIGFIALGGQAYTPSADQKTLRNEVARFPISSGEKLSSTLLHLTAVASGTTSYWVREIGIFLTDGTLLAVWSHLTEALAYKAPNIDLLLAYDLSLAALPADSVTITSTAGGLNLTLAEPLAAQATALIAEQLRGVLLEDRLVSQERLQRIAGEQISGLLDRMATAEKSASETRDALLSATVANATGLMALQYTVLQHIYGS